MADPASSVFSSELDGFGRKTVGQVIELSDTDDSATEYSDSDIEIVPNDTGIAAKRRKLEAASINKGKAIAGNTSTKQLDAARVIYNIEDDEAPIAGPSNSTKKTRLSDNADKSSNETSFEEYPLLQDGMDDEAYARALHEDMNGEAYHDNSLLNPEELAEEDDATLAARLYQEDLAAEATRRAQEESDSLYAKVAAQQEELAEKRMRENYVNRMKEGTGAEAEGEKKIAFQVSMDGDGKTIEGDDDADNLLHLALVKNDFLANGMQAGLKIEKVTYFVNFTLNQRFEAAKDALAFQGRDATERTLFHGTPGTNVQPILENGFHVGGVDGARVVNGTAYGVGVYLATSPLTSVGYCAGSKRMFACRVVTGLTTTTPQHGPPLPVGQNSFDAYANGGIVVARPSHQVLPKYVVEYTIEGAQYDYTNIARQMGIPILRPSVGGTAGAPRAVKAPRGRKPKAIPQAYAAMMNSPRIDPITMLPVVDDKKEGKKRKRS